MTSFLWWVFLTRIVLNSQADSFYGHEGGHATRDFMPVGASVFYILVPSTPSNFLSTITPKGGYAPLVQGLAKGTDVRLGDAVTSIHVSSSSLSLIHI